MEDQRDIAKPRWGQARRLAFIDLRLQYDGKINRRDLQEYFEISTPQASADLDLYKRLAAENLAYDASERTYLKGEHFDPQFGRSSATSYLDELYRLERGVVNRDESFVGFIPPTGIVATPSRSITSEEVAILVQAIRDQIALEVVYQSMDEPGPITRVISPHAFGFDGLRWHVRAWCHQRSTFRDFAIGRLEYRRRVDGYKKIDPSTDIGWVTQVDLVLVPHPKLSLQQRLAVMKDYEMRDDKLILPCRKAMIFYTLRHLNLHSPDVLEDPARQHVVLLNREEVDRWMAEDRAASI